MGFSVLLTRAREDAERDRKIFERRGFEVKVLPLIRFEELPFEPPRLEEFDYLYFGSKRAAEFFLPKVGSLPKSLKVVAVGEKTASFLEEKFGIKPSLVLDGYSETLLRWAKEGRLPAGRILAPLPEENTGKVQKLSEFGFEVKVVHPYRTVFVRYPRGVVEEALKGVDVVVFASPSAFKSLIANLQNNLGPLNRKKIAVIGKTTAAAVKRHNINVWLIPSKPAAEVLAEELAEALNGAEG